MLIIVSDQEINKYNRAEKVILVSKTLADKYSLTELKEVIENGYDFGGQSDISADVVVNENHYFFSWLEENT